MQQNSMQENVVCDSKPDDLLPPNSPFIQFLNECRRALLNHSTAAQPASEETRPPPPPSHPQPRAKLTSRKKGKGMQVKSRNASAPKKSLNQASAFSASMPKSGKRPTSKRVSSSRDFSYYLQRKMGSSVKNAISILSEGVSAKSKFSNGAIPLMPMRAAHSKAVLITQRVESDSIAESRRAKNTRLRTEYVQRIGDSQGKPTVKKRMSKVKSLNSIETMARPKKSQQFATKPRSSNRMQQSHSTGKMVQPKGNKTMHNDTKKAPARPNARTSPQKLNHGKSKRRFKDINKAISESQIDASTTVLKDDIKMRLEKSQGVDQLLQLAQLELAVKKPMVLRREKLKNIVTVNKPTKRKQKKLKLVKSFQEMEQERANAIHIELQQLPSPRTEDEDSEPA